MKMVKERESLRDRYDRLVYVGDKVRIPQKMIERLNVKYKIDPGVYSSKKTYEVVSLSGRNIGIRVGKVVASFYRRRFVKVYK